MHKSNTTLVKISDFSSSYPQKDIKSIISRKNYITQLDSYFEKNNLIFLDGEEGSGKTMICFEFAELKQNKCITVFFNQLNSFDFEIEHYYANMISQMKFILNEDIEDIENFSSFNIANLRNNFIELRKRNKNIKDNIYIIIDGLEFNLSKNKDLVTKIFESLQFGDSYGNFKYLITGSQNIFKEQLNLLSKIDYKTLSITGFTTDEIIKYLELDNPQHDYISDILKITKGYPGRLLSSKRLLESQKCELSELVDSETYLQWLEIDCHEIDLNCKITNVVLSILSLKDSSFSLDVISKIIDEDIENLKSIIGKLNVLEVSNNELVVFISPAYKKYFADKLKQNNNDVNKLLLQYYSDDATLNSKFELAKILVNDKKWDDILNIFDNGYFINTIETTQTRKRVKECIEIGLIASKNAQYYSESYKFSLNGSLINELDNYSFWESEILARISLKDFKGAIMLAETAVFKVDRLRLLALVAKKEKIINKQVDEQLIDLIQEVYGNTDLSSVGNVIFDIVADLIYALPNLAFEILENSSGNVSEKNINDWIIAKLSYAAIDSSSDEGDKEKNSQALDNLNNPSVKKINRAISFLVGNYDVIKVLEEVRKLTDSSERLKLLRLWLDNHKGADADIDLVINRALDELVISTSDDTVTLEVLKNLSSRVKEVKNPEKKHKLYERFKGIQDKVSTVNSTRDKYVYFLNLFQIEFELFYSRAIISLNNILKEIESISDELVKLESYSEVYVKLLFIKDENVKSKKYFVYNKIQNLSDSIIKVNANHYDLLKDSIKILSKYIPEIYLKKVEDVNTSINRDKCRFLILDSYLNNPIKFIKKDILNEIYNSFESDIPKEYLIKSVLERYVESKSLPSQVIKDLDFFMNLVYKIQNQTDKVRAYILVVKVLYKNSIWYEKLGAKYLGNLHTQWKNVEADWERIDLGYEICSELAQLDIEYSKKIFNETEEIKNSSWVDSDSIATTYIRSLSLVVRAYCNLSYNNQEVEKDFKILEELISRIPSEIVKLRIWTDVSLRVYLEGKIELSRKVYNNHIIHLLTGILTKKTDIDSVIDSFIVLYLYNPEMVNDKLINESSERRDEIYFKISEFILNKKNPFEVYDDNSNSYNNVEYTDVIKVISLLKNVETDKIIYFIINSIFEAINESKPLSTNKVQKSEFKNKLIEIIDEKFPDKRNIKHDGYKIISRVRAEILDKNNVDFNNLLEEVNLINNLSDRLFVKSNLLEILPFDKLKTGTRKKYFDEIVNDLQLLNSHYEYVHRVNDVSKAMFEVDKKSWKSIVNEAFNHTLKFDNDNEVYDSQKMIIDTMYRLDSDFARNLVNSSSEHNGDSRNKKHLKRYLDTLEMSNKIKNNQSLEQKELQNNKMTISAIHKAHASLNSGKVTANFKKIQDLIEYLKMGKDLSLQEIYPLFAYYLSSCGKAVLPKKLNNSRLSDINRNNFKETVNATNLIQILSQKRKSNDSQTRKYFIDENFSTNKAINPGTREEAMSIVREWLNDNLDGYISITDAYFSVDDIEILKVIKEINPEVEIDVLTTYDSSKKEFEEECIKQWNKICYEKPPVTKFVMCYVPDNNNARPLHDRWLLTNKNGLRLGTSFNGLGIKNESEISYMDYNEALEIMENTIKGYLNMTKKEINGCRVLYKSFSI